MKSAVFKLMAVCLLRVSLAVLTGAFVAGGFVAGLGFISPSNSFAASPPAAKTKQSAAASTETTGEKTLDKAPGKGDSDKPAAEKSGTDKGGAEKASDKTASKGSDKAAEGSSAKSSSKPKAAEKTSSKESGTETSQGAEDDQSADDSQDIEPEDIEPEEPHSRADEAPAEPGNEKKAAASASASGSASPSPSASPESKASPSLDAPMKFGLILPLSGAAAAWGKEMRNAAMLAFEDLEPDVRKKMALVFEDDQLKGTNAVSAFNKLVDVDKVKSLIVFGGQSVMPIAPLAEKKEMPFFAITANKDAVKGKLFAFRHWLDSSEQVRVLLPYLRDRDITNVSVVVVTHEAMLDYVTKFAVAAAQGGIEISSKDEVSPQETDFKAIVAKLKESAPEALLLVLLPPQLSIFTKKLRDAGVDVPLFGFANTETTAEVKAAVGAMDGMIYTAPKLQKDFVKRFQDRFEDFPELSTGNVYDMVKIWGAAVKSGATDARGVANFLRRLRDFEGVMGVYSITDENDFSLKAELKRIKRGSFRPVDEQ